MAADSYEYTERKGPEYRPGNPVVFAFHGTDADETQVLPLVEPGFPEALMIAPRANVTAHGALRFFRREADGAYDMDDLARRTGDMAAFVAAHVARLTPSRVVGLGYSNGANILTSIMLAESGLFGHAVLMHPMIPWPIAAGDELEGVRVLVTAGGRDPLCPPETTGQLIDGLEGRGATVRSVWHPGGHEIAQNETEAVIEFINAIRAGLADPKQLPVEREQDEAGKGRYLVRAPGDAVAEMTYRHTGADQLIIDHTDVPDAFRGTGTGLRLLERLIDDARSEGRRIIPLCPFAAAQFEKHPEWSDILAYRIRTRGG